MTDLTPEKIAELREVAPRWPVLAALLDERDALARDVSKLAWMNGELALEVGLCREALGVDEDTDPHHAAQQLAAAVERVQALAPVDVSDWDEGDPLMVSAADLHRALDGPT